MAYLDVGVSSTFLAILKLFYSNYPAMLIKKSEEVTSNFNKTSFLSNTPELNNYLISAK